MEVVFPVILLSWVCKPYSLKSDSHSWEYIDWNQRHLQCNYNDIDEVLYDHIERELLSSGLQSIYEALNICVKC